MAQPLQTANWNDASKLSVSHSSSSSADTISTVPFPIKQGVVAPPPPPPYPAPPLYGRTILPDNDEVNYGSDHSRSSLSSLENLPGDQDEEIGNDENANTEPLWFHGNIDP